MSSSSSKKITVHHLEQSRSQRILWLLEELKLEYDVVFYKRDPVSRQAPKELKQIHPLGKSPVITDGDLTIAETGAIIEYLIENYADGKFIPPPKTPEKLRYTYWMHYCEGSAMPPIVMKVVFKVMPEKVGFLIKPLVGIVASKAQDEYVDIEIMKQINFWESELQKTEYFAGSEFTACDIMMGFPLEVVFRYFAMDKFPKIKEFLDKVHARPAYIAANEKSAAFDPKSN